MSGRHGTSGTVARRSPLLLAVATVLGLWFGIGAPDTSPVVPAVPAGQVQPADDAGAGPAALPQDDRGDRRGGRR